MDTRERMVSHPKQTVTPLFFKMKKDAIFDETGKYRYVLSRIWEPRDPSVMVIGLNPSTANAEDDDPTIRNLCALLKASGYGGLYMTNLFALVTPNPEDLRVYPDPVKDNDHYLYYTAHKCQQVFFAWGSFKQAQYRVKKVTAMFPNAYCFGKTSKGHPLHPLAATVWCKSKVSIQLFSTEKTQPLNP